MSHTLIRCNNMYIQLQSECWTFKHLDLFQNDLLILCFLDKKVEENKHHDDSYSNFVHTGGTTIKSETMI